MSDKKNELVSTTGSKSGNKIALDSSSVRFEAKVGTKELIDSVVFDLEEDLLNNREKLVNQIADLNKQSFKVIEKIGKECDSVVKKYKNKDAEESAKKLSVFLDKKVSVTYSGYKTVKDKKQVYQINVHFSDSSAIRDSNLDYGLNRVAKVFYIDVAQDVLDLIEEQKKIAEEIAKNNTLIAEVDKQIKEIPRKKKKVSAAFVKTLMKNQDLTGPEMLDKLRLELDLAN